MLRVSKSKSLTSLATAGCDTLVALSSATADGAVIFGKNSDRPAEESQPLFQAPRIRHQAGGTVKCQYLEIPQVEETCGVVGSRPYWLWGLEHGVNDRGVAIGNEAVFTKEVLPETGLLGMDLVRLGLERGRTARDSLDVIIRLLEQYGQGGAAHEHVSMMYDNSFLIADSEEAYILETAGKHYAWKKVQRSASISNHIAIGADWQHISKTAREHAIDNGWCPRRSNKKFDFAAAYRSTEYVPPQISEERLRRSGLMLQKFEGKITPQVMMRILCDHYDSGTIFTPGREPSDGKCYSICMHADPVGTTAASVVAHIRKTYPFVTYWAALGNPCCGIYMPLYLQAGLPPLLTHAAGEYSGNSAWWLFKKLDEAAAVNYAERTPRVQAEWAELEQGFMAQTEEKEAEAASLHKSGKSKEAAAVLQKFMQENLRNILPKIKKLMADLP